MYNFEFRMAALIPLKGIALEKDFKTINKSLIASKSRDRNFIYLTFPERKKEHYTNVLKNTKLNKKYRVFLYFNCQSKYSIFDINKLTKKQIKESFII